MRNFLLGYWRPWMTPWLASMLAAFLFLLLGAALMATDTMAGRLIGYGFALCSLVACLRSLWIGMRGSWADFREEWRRP